MEEGEATSPNPGAANNEGAEAVGEEEGKMRFYDFKRRLGDKGSEVIMMMIIIMIFMIMTMMMMMVMMILFNGDDDDYASICKV